MRTFKPDLTVKETRWILGNHDSMTFDDLYDLVKDSADSEFDPMEKAFQLIEKNGYVDLEKVATAFGELGIEGVTVPIMREVANEMLKRKNLGSEHDRRRGRVNAKSFEKLCDFRPGKDEEDIQAQAPQDADVDAGTLEKALAEANGLMRKMSELGEPEP